MKRKKPKRKRRGLSTRENRIPYSKYRIEWFDIASDSGWASEHQFDQMKLARPVNEGWVFSKDDDSVKIFASYDLDPSTKEITFGDITMIQTSWVVKMTKIN